MSRAGIGAPPSNFGGPGGGGLLTTQNNHLDSIKRGWDYHPEEHRNLPPTGLPSSAQSVAPSTAPAAAGSGGSNVRISVPQLFDGRLGLTIQNCWVSSISNPLAAQYGWQVGDHILQVNGHPVSNMQQLSEEIRRATNTHQAVSHPMIFDVFRSGPAALGAPPAPLARKQRWDCCNVCDSGPDLSVAGYGGPMQAPGYGAPIQAPQVERKQRLDCCSADGTTNGTPQAPQALQAAPAAYGAMKVTPGPVSRRRALC
eukprot:symbB.v1.2.034084.t2/scaffold4337.1/size40994/4